MEKYSKEVIFMADNFNTECDGLEDEYGYYSLASEFFEAAKTLNNHVATSTKFDSVTFYLLGHASELYLKSYLYTKQGKERFQSETYGHSLEKLIERAIENDLHVKLECLSALGSVYQCKMLEYRKNSAMELPNQEALMQEVEVLSQKAFEVLTPTKYEDSEI